MKRNLQWEERRPSREWDCEGSVENVTGNDEESMKGLGEKH
jgi:hypothetical protein